MNITVYCASCENLSDECVRSAQIVGNWIGAHDHTLVYGGVKAGLMHVVAQSTHDAGGRVVGVIPTVFSHRADPVNDEVIATRDLNDRKSTMIDMSHAFVVLPGGIGTIDEWIATLSHVLIDATDHRPIVVVNLDGMYDHQVEQLQATADSAFARRSDIATRSTMVSSLAQLEDVLNQIGA